jgi:dipeptidyl-peptidase 4
MSRRVRAVLLAAAFVLPLPAHAQKLTPERVFSDPGLSGPTARGVALSPDGKLVTYLKPKTEDQNVLDLWAADVTGGEPVRLIDARALAPEEKELSEAEKARRERMRISTRGVVDYAWDDQGRFILVPLEGDLWLAQRADGAVRRLTETPGDEVDAKVSPKGRWISFVRDQNLHVLDVASGRERALTTDGADTLSWGVAEFITQEEMDRDTGYWWSPDETRLALTRVDESGVDVIPRFDIGPEGATVVNQRYPRAGRPNAVVDLYVQDVASGRRTQVDLGPDKDIYLARVDWSKDGRTLYVQRQSRDQRRLDLLAADPTTGRTRVVLTETAPHWIELTHDFKPLANGDFLWTSERSGNRHVYLYRGDGRLIRQVTRGDWPVAKLAGLDEQRKIALVQGGRETPIEQHLYAVSWERPGEPKKLTSGSGWWSTTVARTGGAFTGTYSDPNTPPRTGLYAADGRLVRWIEANALDARHPYFPYLAGHRTPEFGTLRAPDGQAMHYSVTTPPGFDPRRKYPAIVLVYGGPTAQRVTRAWPSVEERLYLEAGYVLFKLDNRGSGNRSTRFKSALNRRLGTVEVEDQVAGIRWLKSQPYIDPQRVGVSGWSYGGYMALMMMTEPEAGLAAGAAGAPVTAWRLYDTHYTERFMDTPKVNAAGYAASEVVPRLDKLTGDLLLIHGMADDNVTFDNTTRVMAALQAKGTPFETMVYPGERHGIRGNPKRLHLWRTWLDFFARSLKPGS